MRVASLGWAGGKMEVEAEARLWSPWRESMRRSNCSQVSMWPQILTEKVLLGD